MATGIARNARFPVRINGHVDVMTDGPAGGPTDEPADLPAAETEQTTSPQVTGLPGPEHPRNLSPFARPPAVRPPRPASKPVNPPKKVQDRADWLAERLTSRDREIVETLYRVKIATSAQIRRLHFSDRPENGRICRRVLKRLIDWRALEVAPSGRRIGGEGGGSNQKIYQLDPAAYRLMWLLEGNTTLPKKLPKYSTWLEKHTLEITGFYVRCVEMQRAGILPLNDFQTEPRCWWPDGKRGFLKPDAHLRIGILAKPGRRPLLVRDGSRHGKSPRPDREIRHLRRILEKWPARPRRYLSSYPCRRIRRQTMCAARTHHKTA